MTYLLMQTFLLLLSAYFLGAFVACAARRWLQPDAGPQPAYAPAYREAVPQMPRATLAPPLAPAVDERAYRPAPVIARARTIDPVQPRIEVVPRPPIRPIPKVADTSRFERALFGPELNHGMPRICVMEICPAVLSMVTGPAAPWPPPKPVEPVVIDEFSDGESFVMPPPATTRAGGRIVPARPVGMAGALAGAAAAAISAAKAAAESVAVPEREEPPHVADEEPDVLPPVFQAARRDVDPGPVDIAADREDTRDDDRSMFGAKEDLAERDDTDRDDDDADDRGYASSDDDDEPDVETNVAPVAAAPRATITDGDDLQRIRAINADTEQDLKWQRVLHFDDIARWSPADVDRVDQALGLGGRIDREQWVEQAQILAKGGETYYSRNRARAVSPSSEPATVVPTAPTPSPAPLQPFVPKVVAPETPTPAPQAPVPASPPASLQNALQGAGRPQKSVAELAAAAAAAIAAASASVTRGIRPIEPISPLSKADPNRTNPARLSDALRPQMASASQTTPAYAPADPDTPEDPDGDDLKRIRGVGVLIEKRLNALGVTRYAQVANWTSDDIERVSQTLDFKGRIERENWVEQARILSSGGQTEFSRRVDRGDVETSKDS